MNGFMSVLLTIAAVVGAVVLIGGSLALVRGSYNKARIQALREDNTDLRDRIDDCEDKIEAAAHKEEALEIEVQHLRSENDLLKAMVTQRADVQTVLKKLNEHHEQAMDVWQRLLAATESQGGVQK
jgi:outer membrane murein-binding lipoprotein Lpp